MYTQGAVPDSPPESPRPSPPSSGADGQLLEPRGLHSPPGQPRMARNSNSNSNSSGGGGGGGSGDSSDTTAPRSSPGGTGGPQSREPPTRARSDSPVTALDHPAPSSDGTPPSPPRRSSPPRQRGGAASSVVVAVPEHQQQQQRPAAAGAGRVLRYRDGLVDGSIYGYAKSARSSSPRHWHDVAAVLAGRLEANVISLRRARELDLEVEPLRAGEEGAAFDFGTGAPPGRSIGRAVFVFKTLSHFHPRHPVITVTCDVCEDSPVGLILGKPFVEERERRWPNDPSEG
ncbi:uncharacterized protein P884DRAFT_278545 [Thermothelomyces heterothallicus CBS 202.75]|uniref:uncharacterized protein n=1 Tax=Thermothelomyces heterothallicus CBS 202.75 TaxID=1149848 RepID=UPI00374418AA